MKKTINYKFAGFTLIELLIYMSLVAIFLIVLTDIFVAMLNIRLESQSTSSVARDGRFILARLNYDIARASSITIPTNTGSVENILSMDIAGTTYTYQVSSNNLQLNDTIGTYNLNGSDTKLSGIAFQRIGNVGGKDTVRIQFTIVSTTKSAGQNETRTFTTTVGRR